MILKIVFDDQNCKYIAHFCKNINISYNYSMIYYHFYNFLIFSKDMALYTYIINYI